MKRWVPGLLCLAATLQAAAAVPFRLALEDGSGWIAPGDLAGRPAVFLFWDTECAPCLQELKHSAELRRAFPQAVLVAVSLSGRDATRRTLAKVKLDADVRRAASPDSPRGLLASLGDPGGSLPFTAIFAGDGAQCLHRLGPLTAEVLTLAASRCSSQSPQPP